ncbi:fimbrial protein [Citrobacter freundii]
MMNKVIFFTFLLFFSTFSYGSCKDGIFQSKTDTKSYNVEFQPKNLQAEDKINLSFVEPFTCYAGDEKMLFQSQLDKKVFSIGGPQGIKFKIYFDVGESFSDIFRNNTRYPASAINKELLVKTEYLPQTASVDENIQGDSVLINNAFTISSDKCTWFLFWCISTSANKYVGNLTVNIVHRATTCDFSSAIYFIQMDDITTKELLAGETKRSQPKNIVLNCNGIFGATSNPVSLSVTDGDWGPSGGILMNNNGNGAQNVGFKIYNDSTNARLSKGDRLLSLSKYSKIDSQYIFPVSAEYARTNDNIPTAGAVDSKVIFKITYQ